MRAPEKSRRLLQPRGHGVGALSQPHPELAAPLSELCGGQGSPRGCRWGEGRALAYLGVLRQLWWGLPLQGGDQVEDAVGGWVVRFVDGKRLLGLLLVLVGVLLLRREASGLSTPHASLGRSTPTPLPRVVSPTGVPWSPG